MRGCALTSNAKIDAPHKLEILQRYGIKCSANTSNLFGCRQEYQHLPHTVFFSIALPGALPSILAGMHLGVGMGLILITIAEMIGADSGIGFMIWRAWQTLSVETMHVGLLTTAVLGYMPITALAELERWLLHEAHWKRNRLHRLG